jgi:mannose-1-phosphate guanylyltransferase
MFVWRASVILQAFKAYLPAMYDGLMEIKGLLEGGSSRAVQERLEGIFSAFESISIDFGVLEHAQNCLVVDAEEFGWNDVGSWDQWAESFTADENGNLLEGDSLAIDSTGCVVRAEKRLIAAVGLKDVVVIDAGDALLVVSRDRVQDVRKVVEELKQRGRKDLT